MWNDFFYSHPKKCHLRKKSFALSLVLKVKFLELGNGLLAHQDPHLASTNCEWPTKVEKQKRRSHKSKSSLFLLTLTLSSVSCPINLVCSRSLVAASNHRSLQFKSLIALKVTNASIHIVTRARPQPSICRWKKNRTSKNWRRKFLLVGKRNHA